jgi:tetratricopeptide (TPR) repeat protein
VIRRDQGRLGEHEETIQAIADRFHDHPAWRPGLAALYAELGREAEARKELEALAANELADLPRDFLWLVSTVWLGEACAFLGDRRLSGVLYELMLPHAGKYAWAGYTNVPVGPSSRVLGLLATVMARWEDAVRHFEDALELTARMGARPNHARTQRDYAAMLLARDEAGDRDRAVGLLDGALETAEELGMKRLLEDATRLRTEATGALDHRGRQGEARLDQQRQAGTDQDERERGAQHRRVDAHGPVAPDADAGNGQQLGGDAEPLLHPESTDDGRRRDSDGWRRRPGAHSVPKLP